MWFNFASFAVTFCLTWRAEMFMMLIDQIAFDDSENSITDTLELHFSIDEERYGQIATVNLKPDGENLLVDDNNKLEYVEYGSSTRKGTRNVEG